MGFIGLHSVNLPNNRLSELVHYHLNLGIFKISVQIASECLQAQTASTAFFIDSFDISWHGVWAAVFIASTNPNALKFMHLKMVKTFQQIGNPILSALWNSKGKSGHFGTPDHYRFMIGWITYMMDTNQSLFVSSVVDLFMDYYNSIASLNVSENCILC